MTFGKMLHYYNRVKRHFEFSFTSFIISYWLGEVTLLINVSD